MLIYRQCFVGNVLELDQSCSPTNNALVLSVADVILLANRASKITLTIHLVTDILSYDSLSPIAGLGVGGER